ncbi:MAG: HPr family phosphocarrier protein [Clostridia bacterium]|nr:HPr family phosphocarrier protein [Clostridia bacterium]
MESITVVKIRLVTIADLYNFVAISGKYDFDVELKSGRYTVDGKSIMGMFCLDLREELELTAHTDSTDPFFAEIEAYIVK